MSLKNLSAKIKIPKLLKVKLNNKRVKNIYTKFEKSLNLNKNFVVAVSGGPDSLALAFLSKIYSLKHKLSVDFLIIDHKLRHTSSSEAKKVQQVLKKYSIDSKIIVWSGKKPTKNIQSIARNKRYDLMFKRCKSLKVNNLVLGHHQDDLIENFFLRLLRGSGLKGLISLEKENKINGINLLRPLLYQKKEDLIFIANYVFGFYINDPSNQDTKYKRTVVRKLIEELKNNGFDKNKFLKTINNLKYSDKVVSYYVNENLKKNTFFFKKKNKMIIQNMFFQQPEEVIFRGITESIKLIGKKYYSVRGKKIEKIINDIKNKDKFKVTLGGCIIEKVNQTAIISKEH